mmetsp:Transcript_6049/g.18597  ORF Transcript_6049/g.18597 Transcript_6049/m.18597 type:complete len:194 (-) Transcript_6049:169-750(-)
MLRHLRECLLDFLSEFGGAASEEEVRRYLSEIGLGTSSALAFIEHECGSLSDFVADYAADELRLRRMIGRNVLQLRDASTSSLQEARRGRVSGSAEEATSDNTKSEVGYEEALLSAQSMLCPDDVVGEFQVSTDSSPSSRDGEASSSATADVDVSEETLPHMGSFSATESGQGVNGGDADNDGRAVGETSQQR